MPTALTHPTNRRSGRAARLVNPRRPRTRFVRRSALAAAQSVPRRTCWQALLTGLLAAEHMQAIFPAFFATHVAHRPTTIASLFGVTQAFFSLAEQQITLARSDELQTNPQDPAAVLEVAATDEGWLIDTLAHDVRRDLVEIWPAVFGLDHPDDDWHGPGMPVELIGTICWVFASVTDWGTPWINHDAFIPALQHQLYQCRMDPAIITALNAVAPLPKDLPMEALCAALDAHPPIAGITLGEVVRYCCHATGNQYADLSYSEVSEMDHSGLDWRTEDLAALGALQQAAQQLAAAYERLNAAALRDASLVTTVIERIATTATTLGPSAHAHGMESPAIYQERFVA